LVHYNHLYNQPSFSAQSIEKNTNKNEINFSFQEALARFKKSGRNSRTYDFARHDELYGNFLKACVNHGTRTRNNGCGKRKPLSILQKPLSHLGNLDMNF